MKREDPANLQSQASLQAGDLVEQGGAKARDRALAALNFLLKQKGVHAFNLGTGSPVSVYELLHSFEQVCGKEIAYIVVNRRAGDLPIYYAKVDKAKERLGWQASQTLANICSSTWGFQRGG